MEILSRTRSLFFLLALCFLTSCGTKEVVPVDSSRAKDRQQFVLNDGAGGKAYLMSSKAEEDNVIKYVDLQVVFRGKMYRISPSAGVTKFANDTCRPFKTTPRAVIASEPKNMLESLVRIDSEGTVSEAPKDERIVTHFDCVK